MRASTFRFEADDHTKLHVYRFEPDEALPIGIVHVSHGMAEHAGRYARVAEALTRAGYAVFANDHRGHGQTASSEAELGFFASKGGFDRLVRDLEELVAFEKREIRDVPVVLFGHSMGSYFVQELLLRGIAIAGAVLSGSSGKPNSLGQAGRAVARMERFRLGGHGKSAILRKLSFDAFNKAFAPNRTGFDWLSRDPAEVDAYVADPRCGFACTTALWVDVLDGIASIGKAERQAQIRKDLPVYVFAGSEDPVSEKTKSLDQLVDAYRRAGLSRVAYRKYPGARHETLNETNRDQVTGDLVEWLETNVRRG